MASSNMTPPRRKLNDIQIYRGPIEWCVIFHREIYTQVGYMRDEEEQGPKRTMPQQKE
jgi:hypothetical protein